MSKRRITVIQGDGIGPDIVDATLKILDKVGADLEYDFVNIGQTALEKDGELLPQKALDSVEKNGVVLKGPVTTPVGKGFSSVNVALRKKFELYANVRPVLSFDGTQSRYKDIDIITVRENIEGIYSGFGQTVSEDGERAELTSVITRTQSKQLVRFAYDMARRLGRKKITVVHKANIMKSTSALFLKAAQEVGDEYPDIEHNEIIVDACAMRLVMNPERFDVIVTTNLFGDILSDLCAGLVGGLGMAPGANMGEKQAMFEAVHGSAPDIAGQNIANPTSIILAAALMLDHLDQKEHAEAVRKAVRAVVAEGKDTTPDLGGNGTTSGYADAVIARL